MLGMLVPCGGGPAIPLLKNKLVVGRNSACDIPLPLPALSNKHCQLEFVDGFWSVMDLGSSNGTRVNGVPCTTRWLHPRDELTLAKYRYRIRYDPPAGRQPPEIVTANSVGQRLAPSMTRPRVLNEHKLGTLVPCGGGDVLTLTKPEMILGRQRGCDLVLTAHPVSSRHCRLELSDGYWFVHDLGSRNGTFVDGTRCDFKILMPKAVLGVATLRYRIHYNVQEPTKVKDIRTTFSKGLLDAAGVADWVPAEHDDAPRPGAHPEGFHGRTTLDDE